MGPVTLRRDLALYYAIAAFISLGFSIVQPFMQYYVEALENPYARLPEEREMVRFTPAALLGYAYMNAVFMAVRAPSAFLFGVVGDRVGKAAMIRVGTGIYLFVGLVYVFAQDVSQAVAARAMQGVASAMVWPLLQGAIASSTERAGRGRALAVYWIISNVTWLVGPAIGGFLYRVARLVSGSDVLIDVLRTAFLMLAAILVIPFLLSFLVPEPPTRIDARPRPNEGALRVINVMALLNGLSMGIASTIIIVFLSEYVNGDPAVIGAIITVAGLLGTAASYPVARLSDLTGERGKLVVAGQLLSRGALLLMPLFRDPAHFTAVYTAMMVGFNISAPNLGALQAELAGGRLGSVYGKFQAFMNAGAALGPIIGALCYIGLGPIAAFWTAALFGLLGLATFVAGVYKDTSRRMH